MKHSRVIVLTFALVASLCHYARGDDAAQIVKAAKGATALALLPGDRGSGSAFCIDASGLFVTNS